MTDERPVQAAPDEPASGRKSAKGRWIAAIAVIGVAGGVVALLGVGFYLLWAA